MSKKLLDHVRRLPAIVAATVLMFVASLAEANQSDGEGQPPPAGADRAKEGKVFAPRITNPRKAQTKKNLELWLPKDQETPAGPPGDTPPKLNSRTLPHRPPVEIPTAEAIDATLAREPFSLQTWPAWKLRLRAWLRDRSHSAERAYNAARAFLRSQTDDQGGLTGPLAGDAFAWYLLAGAYLRMRPEEAPASGRLELAERALRRSLAIDPSLPQAHAVLAVTLLQEVADSSRADVAARMRDERWQEYDRELAEARRLDPTLPLKWLEGESAMVRMHFVQAEQLFREAIDEEPLPNFAQRAGFAIIAQDQRNGSFEDAMLPLVLRFPNDGPLTAIYGAALARDGDYARAADAFQQARALGTDPAMVFDPQLIKEVEDQARPGIVTYIAFALGGFAGFYGVVMLAMAGFGLVLARRTRGTRALDLLGGSLEHVVAGGQVVRTEAETVLAQAYAVMLLLGLVLFYVAIPFLIVALLAGAGAALYFIFTLPRIPVRLVLIVLVLGLGGAWAIIKGMLTRPARGSFGLLKGPDDCPHLHELLAQVAESVGTEPVDQVVLAPGAAIGVHQEGRGPFGAFGVKQRVLTLGLSTMHFLTVSELKSILAHECAHFSHHDTFYSRFIQQVTLSIGEAARGLGQTGGRINYFNPVYWFLILYHKAYSLLSAGFSRSREFLADRMAASLYGSDVFTTALTKVATDGALFETSIYQSISSLLDENKAFVNMYQAFREFREAEAGSDARRQLFNQLENEKESLFASHPTFLERLDAIADMPLATNPDTQSALSLFDNPEEIEQELTQFLVAFMAHLRQASASVAKAG
jgi:Zn-dependent protease with chaperone function/tetratricopeptide (TPR) repeat protein